MSERKAITVSSLTRSRSRSRVAYAMFVVVSILLGLASRQYPNGISSLFGKYPGDALWAAMVFFGLGALRPEASTLNIALLAFATSFSVEFMKLYQAPWIVGIRDTTAGHLVFGRVFAVWNLVAYAVGIWTAATGEWLWADGGSRTAVSATAADESESAPVRQIDRQASP